MVLKIIHLLGEFLTSGRVSSAIHVYRHYTTSGGSNYINGQTKGGCYLQCCAHAPLGYLQCVFIVSHLTTAVSC